MQIKQDYRDLIFRRFPLDGENFEELMRAISFRKIAPGTTLLSEGEIATKLFLVVRGCLRMYFIKENGKDITAQFFVENQIERWSQTSGGGCCQKGSQHRQPESARLDHGVPAYWFPEE